MSWWHFPLPRIWWQWWKISRTYGLFRKWRFKFANFDIWRHTRNSFTAVDDTSSFLHQAWRKFDAILHLLALEQPFKVVAQLTHCQKTVFARFVKFGRDFLEFEFHHSVQFVIFCINCWFKFRFNRMVKLKFLKNLV